MNTTASWFDLHALSERGYGLVDARVGVLR